MTAQVGRPHHPGKRARKVSTSTERSVDEQGLVAYSWAVYDLLNQEKQPKQPTEGTDLGLTCGELSTTRCTRLNDILQGTIKLDASRPRLLLWPKCTCQTIFAPNLADRYTHARQQSNSVEVGARRAVQDLLRAFCAYDGQMLEKNALLDFLQRCVLK